MSELVTILMQRWEARQRRRDIVTLITSRIATMPEPVCGICADGLCETHDEDCVFRNVSFLPCACPNRSDA